MGPRSSTSSPCVRRCRSRRRSPPSKQKGSPCTRSASSGRLCRRTARPGGTNVARRIRPTPTTIYPRRVGWAGHWTVDAAGDVDDLDTVLGAAVLLHQNGQSTEMTLIAANRLNRGLGVSSTSSRCGHRWLRSAGTAGAGRRHKTRGGQHAAGGGRDARDRLRRGRSARSAARRQALTDAAGERVRPPSRSSSPAPLGPPRSQSCSAPTIFAPSRWLWSAPRWRRLRRLLGRLEIDALAQALTAAIVAGSGGAIAAHLGHVEAVGLAAVCPAMVLVPRTAHPRVAALDLLVLQDPCAGPGPPRRSTATLLLAAIAAGLVLGLRLGGQTLSRCPRPTLALPFTPTCWPPCGRGFLPRLSSRRRTG